jgi:2-polyprenyl-3-methyl-5-hydroxy-6-metoxy-1,4-benzoquinol methylase
MRNHNAEFQDNADRRYAYDFDHLLRGYMLRTLAPWLRPGKALELGCFEGAMTAVLATHCPDLTVVEAADQLIDVARTKVPSRVKFVHSTIEEAEFDAVFDTIFLIHTLEHLDRRVEALARIRTWLAPEGRLLVVVPNAHAASRQIAVKMGLIETNCAVTEGERAHGHRITYSLDTLEHDARSAGLSIESRGGIFFKPFANFQFDLMMEHRVIEPGYLEACYQLGMQYPDLSASIYLVCGR